MNWQVQGFALLAQAAAPSPTPVAGAAEKSAWYFAFYFLSPFIAPCITVGLGGWWIQRSFVSRANGSAFADAIVKRMDEILSDSLEYWNTSAQDQANERRVRILAQKIKGSIRTLNSDVRYFQSKYAQSVKFDPLMDEIQDKCTGGDFESATRTLDSSRYLDSVKAVNALKSQVIRVKL